MIKIFFRFLDISQKLLMKLLFYGVHYEFHFFFHDIKLTESLKFSDPSEESDEAYEVIETPGTSNQDLFSEIISMDLSNRTPLQQIGIGGVSGW